MAVNNNQPGYKDSGKETLGYRHLSLQLHDWVNKIHSGEETGPNTS